MMLWDMLCGQFTTMPYPTEDCTGRTIIITGATSGLGLETARHFVRLNASKVILGCRNSEKAENTKSAIEESTQRKGVVEVWQLDLTSYDSVKYFANQVNKLERLDIFISNAGILMPYRVLCEGYETQITVNVISTLLLSVLILPALRKTAAQFNITPHLVTVSSDGAFAAKLPMKDANNIIDNLDTQGLVIERYTVTKLLQLMFMRRLAEGIDASGKGHIIVNALNPGLCKTDLWRRFPFPFNLIAALCIALIGRSSEMGSRTVVSAAFAGEETHGNWMTDCKLHKWTPLMDGEEGEKLTTRIWNELLAILEGIQPGVTQNI